MRKIAEIRLKFTKETVFTKKNKTNFGDENFDQSHKNTIENINGRMDQVEEMVCDLDHGILKDPTE